MENITKTQEAIILYYSLESVNKNRVKLKFSEADWKNFTIYLSERIIKALRPKDQPVINKNLIIFKEYLNNDTLKTVLKMYIENENEEPEKQVLIDKILDKYFRLIKKNKKENFICPDICEYDAKLAKLLSKLFNIGLTDNYKKAKATLDLLNRIGAIKK